MQDWGHPILGNERKRSSDKLSPCVGTEQVSFWQESTAAVSQDQTQEVIDQDKRQAPSARQTLDNIPRVEEAGLSRNSPNYPGTPRVNDRHRNARNDMWVSYRELHEQITQLVQVIVPDTESYQSPEAETASVYPIGDHEYHDPIMCMVCSALEESQDYNPNKSIITWMRLNIKAPLKSIQGAQISKCTRCLLQEYCDG